MRTAIAALTWLVFLTRAILASNASSPSIYMDPVLNEVGAWTVGINPKLHGCVVAATYEDHTTLWIGIFDDGATSVPYLALTNSGWNIDAGSTYQLRTIFRRPSGQKNIFDTSFDAISQKEKGIVVTLAPHVVETIAGADTIQILEGRTKQLVRLTLRGSRMAVESLLDCQRELNQLARQAAKAGQNEGPKISTGTGFFVSDGYLLTNHHVVDGCTAVYVMDDKQTRYPSEVKMIDSEHDLAIVKTVMKNVAVATFGDNAKLGESVFVFGYPLSGLLSSSGTFTNGTVSSLAGIGDDKNTLQISAPVQPGNSGSALLNGNGDVIGIVNAKADALQVARMTNDIPQNVNFAVKADATADLFRFTSIKPRKSDLSKRKDAVEIAHLAQAFTAKIICESGAVDEVPSATRSYREALRR